MGPLQRGAKRSKAEAAVEDLGVSSGAVMNDVAALVGKDFGRGGSDFLACRPGAERDGGRLSGRSIR
jgi:hypothetical protein